MLNTLHDNLLGEVMDDLDLNSLGALATAIKHPVKGLYRLRCRSCGRAYVKKLGRNRRLRYWRLKRSDYRCPTCIRRFLRSLQVRLVGVSGDEGLHDALHELGLG